MDIKDKVALLRELCKEYNLLFVDLLIWHGHETAYIGGHYDRASYIKKLSPDQIDLMSPRQLEDLVVECALIEVASGGR